MQPKFDVLIPFLDFEKELESELALNNYKIIYKNSKIFIVDSLLIKPIWAQDWWPNSTGISFDSKSSIIKVLKSKPVLGHYYNAEHKLGKNIVSEIRNFEKKRIEFKSDFKFKYFNWTLVDNFLIVCDTPSSRYPSGWHEFAEDKEFPPNRAYLKLWEVFTLYDIHLDKSESVIDVGSSPGGWSWVLSQLSKKVYSIDRAELDPKISNIKNIEFSKQDAFNLDYEKLKDCTWLFSDIICTPDRLYELVTDCMQNSSIQNFICTLKFKGACDFDIIKKFLEIENSRIIHLYQNKNEVTWIRQMK
ncbi:MAG: SAM-dependent methyltransferase [Pseudobdellovibrio sp.]